jgi:TPR repeat protein
VRWCRNAVDAGFGHGKTNLGMYENGRGVAKDNRQAGECYEKAVAAGDPEAKVDLGIGGTKSAKVTNGDGSPRAATVT